MCVDYRALNKLTVKNIYPLPRIDELMDRLKGAKCFSKINLRSGYHQIPLHLEDVEKTAFRTRYGRFQSPVMFFGLTNAPATFMHSMHTVLSHLVDKTVIVFSDDIQIHSLDPKDHKKLLREVLEVLRKHKLYG